MIVAIGSKRAPKIKAVEIAFREIASRNAAFQITQILSRDVESDTLETPVSIEHLTEGAFNRVRNLQALLNRDNVFADIFIGMEGGLHQVHHASGTHTFLQSWVFASDGTTGHFGSSGNLPLPDSITGQIYSEGESLGTVIDTFSGRVGVRNREGSFGILTDNHITRAQSFQTALLAALAPFYNQNLYQNSN